MPVSFRYAAYKGSSTTSQSGLCAQLYMKLVLQHRGPDQQCMVLVAIVLCACQLACMEACHEKFVGSCDCS
jgi:hypothetical protein